MNKNVKRYKMELEVGISKSKMRDVNPDIKTPREYIMNELEWLSQSFNDIWIKKIELKLK